MSHKKQKFNLILVFMPAFWLLSTIPVYAYSDPGSGSMILQILLGGAAALVVILKLYWNRFLSLIGMDRRKRKTQN